MSIRKFTMTSMLALSLALGPVPVTHFAPVAYAQQAEQGLKVDQLADAIEGLTAKLIKAVRRSDAAALQRDSDNGKMVWASLKDLNAAAGDLANGASLKDDSFHKALGEMVAKTAATATAIEIADAGDAEVTKTKDTLIKAVGAMQANFSKARARADQGGELSAAEKAKLEKIRANQRQLQARLDKLEAKVEGNSRAIEGIRQVRERSQQVSNSGSSVGDFLAAMIAMRIIDGLLWGWHWHWGPWGGWYPGYNVVVIDIYEDVIIDIGYDWDYYDDVLVDHFEYEIADEIDTIDELDFEEAEDYVDEVDFDLEEDLSDDLVDGIDEVTDADLDDLEDAEFDVDTLDEVDLEESLVDDLDGADLEGADLDAADLDDADFGDLSADTLDEDLPPLDDIEADDFSEGTEDLGDLDAGVLDDVAVDDLAVDDLAVDDMSMDDLGGADDFGADDFGADDLGGLDGGFDF